MSRRCHHGSPRHPRLGAPPPRRRTASPIERASDSPPLTSSEGLPEVLPELDDAAILEATAAADTEDLDDLDPGDAMDAGAGEDGAAAAPPPHAATAPVARAARPAAEPLSAPPPANARPDPQPPAEATGRVPSGHVPSAQVASGRSVPPDGHAPQLNGEPGGGPDALERTATAPQLRRFIKSRAYVPMHELRRRFVINGGDDDVTPIDLERERIYVGLPEREGSLLGDLFRAGDIGYELSMDPIAPIVVGVYPMRPVPRG